MGEILSGKRPYPLSFPLVPGGSAIARVESVGADSVSLKAGQLVFCDVTIRARDDPDESILFGIFGGFSATAKRLMDGEWRDATWAEYAKVPLENLYVLNESLLCKGLGYKVEELTTLLNCVVPFGGLCEVGVQPGESVIVAPATGYYGGAAVAVALSMGCLVVAAGRNVESLESLAKTFGASGRIKTVALTGDAGADLGNLKAAAGSLKGADVYIDFSPPAAATSTHLITCLSALRNGGRAVLMGGIHENVSLPYGLIMFNNLRIQGRFMFERKDAERLVKMVECGLLKLGNSIGMERFSKFSLKEWESGIKVAADEKGWGGQALMCP